MFLARFLWRNKEYQGNALIAGQGLVLYSSELGRTLRLEEVTLLPPCQPTKIIGIGPNYKDPSLEISEEPTFFFKPVSSLIGPNETIKLPKGAEDIAFEPELAFVIGKRAYKLSVFEAPGYIAGYTCANDVTAVDLLSPNFNKGKSFDTFTPVGPWLVKDFQPIGKAIKGLWNEQEVISSNLTNLVFSPAHLLSILSNIMTLEPGDLVLTGAKSRYSPLKEGDKVTVSIDGIGELNNKVALN